MGSGICHSFADDGRCISLLKLLLSNACIYDCSYCHNRKTNDIPRATLTVEELVSLTIDFYKRNYIEGLFLSSGIIKNADFTMEMMLSAVKRLRTKEHFNGYIHMKVIPGADCRLIQEAGYYADRLSVNIELPSEASLKTLAPQKSRVSILKPMGDIGTGISEYQEAKKKYRKPDLFAPAGQSTQMIIGASPESDFHILKLSEGLYRKFGLKRVYYSAFVPVNSDPRLPALITPPTVRENRLYQADWLLRFYGFTSNEILNNDFPFLDLELDPKTDFALRNMNLFPVEVQKADYELLLRVPGIGVKSAQKIVAARRFAVLNYEHLKKLGVVLKRAQYFITCSGKVLSGLSRQTPEQLRLKLILSGSKPKKESQFNGSLFGGEY